MKETKLNSKNPILRFKQGKKILFAGEGDELPRYSDTTRNYWGVNGRVYYKPLDDDHATARRLEETDSAYNAVYNKLFSAKPKPTNHISLSNFGSSTGGAVDKVLSKPKPINYGLVTKDGTRYGRDETGKYIKLTSPKSKANVSPMFYGTKAGGRVLSNNGEIGNLISEDQKNKLIATGKFDNDSFSSVQNFQNALNNYFSGDGAGSIIPDNKWGNQTQKAFNLALKKADVPQVSSNISNIPISQQQSLTIPQQLSQINVQQSKPNPIQLNRSDTRWVIKNALGNNAYNYTGAQRKALRNYLNGVNYDENEIKAFGDLNKFKDFMLSSFKKGGLISRNPLNRFKNFFRKVEQ